MLCLTYYSIQDHGLHILHHGLYKSINVFVKELDLHCNDFTAVPSYAIGDRTISCRAKMFILVIITQLHGEDYRLYRILIWWLLCGRRAARVLYQVISSSAPITLFTSLNEAKKLAIASWGTSYMSYQSIIMSLMKLVIPLLWQMKKNTSLVELHMYDNPISGECVQLIVWVLQHYNCRLYLVSS